MTTIQQFYSNNRYIHIWGILAICGLNLLVMHYFIYFNSHLEAETDYTTFVDNFCGVSFDLIILFLLSYVITRRNIKVACYFCFFTTWLWSLSNVIYSRFFYHYLTISAIGQSDALGNSIIIKSIINSTQWTDLYYLIIIPCGLAINKINASKITIQIKTFLIIVGLLFLTELSIHACYVFSDSNISSMGYYRYRLSTLHKNTNRYSLQPNYIHFIRGSVRSLAIEIINTYQGNIKLSNEEISEINDYIKASRKDTIPHNIIRPENIIFILVESYMSFVSDIKINGLEVTPFLNSLQRDSSVYYNRYMHENVTIGESSDGQFTYLTGLLPLRSKITISKAKDNILPGLPKILNRRSRMIIPTVASMWKQDEMCKQYGINNLYTCSDFIGKHNDNLNDEQVFLLAKQKDIESHERFFSFIITMSMHQPYTEQIDSTFIIPTSKTISKELASYLNACHYTDQQIMKYFHHLKQRQIFDKSLIIIASDHAVHCTDFGGVSKDLPFYIIYAKGLQKSEMWNKNCNQVDVYPSLIDILGIKCNWYGLGHSLLFPKDYEGITSKTWQLSELIILSDYFASID